MEKLKSSTEMSKLCCITDLIRFITNEAENLMKGLVHEYDFYILHDSLVLLTKKETITWMKQNVYLPRWLLPINGLKDGTPYSGGAIGNIPEFTP